MSAIFPVVLSGGSGTRLWPLSRTMYPKQFIRFFNDQTSSFLAATLKRLPGEAGFARPIIVCNNDHRFLVQEEAARAGVVPSAIVLEPVARNTAAAAAVAALLVAREDPAGIVVLMPSDHAIKDEPGFLSAVRPRRRGGAHRQARAVRHRAERAAHRLRLHPPRRPAGGLRRRLCRRSLHGEAGPADGSRLLRSPHVFLEQRHLRLRRARLPGRARPPRALHPGRRPPGARRSAGGPGLPPARAGGVRASARHLDRLRRDGAHDLGRRAADRHRLERRRLLVVAVGAERARRRTATRCRATRSCEATTGTYVHSERALVATLGVKDLVIVDTPDALLVADRCQGAGGVRHRRAPEAGRPQGAGAAPAQLSALGLLRDAQPRPALPGQAAARQAGGQALHADAPSPLRALGGGARHGQGRRSAGRRSWCARTSPSTSSPPSGTGSRTPARPRWRSSRCRSAATSARTTSCARDDVYNRAPDETR